MANTYSNDDVLGLTGILGRLKDSSTIDMFSNSEVSKQAQDSNQESWARTFLLSVELGIKCRVSPVLGTVLSLSYSPASLFYFCWSREVGSEPESHSKSQVDLTLLAILLPQPLEFWDYRCEPPCWQQEMLI